MCCAPTEYKEEEINGTCTECDGPTVDGFAFESCGYSPAECDSCGYAPCDNSC